MENYSDHEAFCYYCHRRMKGQTDSDDPEDQICDECMKEVENYEPELAEWRGEIVLAREAKVLKRISEQIRNNTFPAENAVDIRDVKENRVRRMYLYVGTNTRVYYECLPEEIGELTQLEYLDTCRILADRFPDSFWSLENLEDLRVKGLKRVGPELGRLKKLRKLKLELEEVPEAIGELKELEKLHLTSPTLTELPESIGNLTRIYDVILDTPLLERLPETVGQWGTQKVNISILDVQIWRSNLKYLPATIGQWRDIRELIISDTPLVSLPESVGQWGKIEEVRITHTNLESLPESIGRWSKIDEVRITHTPLESLPESIGQWSKTKTIYLEHTALRELPKSICQLKELESLEIAHTPLERLPDCIEGLEYLEKLTLKHTALKELPRSFCQLRRLCLLTISNTHLDGFPEVVEKMPNLRGLTLGGEEFTALPRNLDYPLLEGMSLIGTRIFDIPKEFVVKRLWCTNEPATEGKEGVDGSVGGPELLGTEGRRENLDQREVRVLEELEGLVGERIPEVEQCDRIFYGYTVENNHVTGLGLCCKRLKTLPEELDLPYLRTLSLTGNELIMVPATIGKLEQLERLDLDNNKLNKIPDTLGNLSNLRVLRLHNNDGIYFELLPDTLGNLTNLRELYVYNNNLTTLPNTLGKLERLEVLDARWNDRVTLSKEFQFPPNLRILNMGGCGSSVFNKYQHSGNTYIQQIPESLWDMSQLEELYLWGGTHLGLDGIPVEIGRLTSLRCLYIDASDSIIPNTIGELVNLQKLYIEDCYIEQLPSTIGNLVNLEQLEVVSACTLKSTLTLPKELEELTNLREIRLSRSAHYYSDYNKIVNMPEGFEHHYMVKSLLFGGVTRNRNDYEVYRRVAKNNEEDLPTTHLSS